MVCEAGAEGRPPRCAAGAVCAGSPPPHPAPAPLSGEPAGHLAQTGFSVHGNIWQVG